MPLTVAERTALKMILDDDDLTAIIDVFDPANNADRTYIKTQVQAARDDLAARRALIPSRAQTESAMLLNRINILDGLLAKLP